MKLFKLLLLLSILTLILSIWVVLSMFLSFLSGAIFMKSFAFLYGMGVALIFLIYPKIKNRINNLFT